MKLIFKIVFLILYVTMCFLRICPDDLPLTGQLNSGNYTASQTINTNASISPNSQVTLVAGTSITLQPGFSTGENVEFLATIGPCNRNAQEHTLAWSNYPSAVASGSTYTTDLVYTLTEPGVIHLILADENWNKIGEASSDNLAAGTATASLTFTLTGPPSASINYLQARLLNTNWEEIGVPNLTEEIPAESGNPLENSISWNNINNLPDNITAGASYPIAINYILNVPGIVYLQVMDADFNNIGHIWPDSPLNAGEGTASLTLPVNDNISSSTFYMQAQLFDANWMSLGVAPIQEQIRLNSDCPQFGIQQSDDPSGTVYQQNSTDPKPNDVNLTADGAWTGYHTNWYIGPNWRGPIKANWGYADQIKGYNFWMEWENTQAPNSGHGELDVRIQKHIYSSGREQFGYPTRVGDLPNALNCLARGQWAPCSRGRGHINLTAWVWTLETEPDPNNPQPSDEDFEKIDIIIHGWDNSGNMSAHDGWNIIGRPTSGGITYDILQRTGDVNEKASFNIVPHVNGEGMEDRVPIERDYPNTDEMCFDIDAKFFIDWIKNNVTGDDGAPMFTNDWYLVGLEWTITPQSQAEVDEVFIPASKGRWTFDEYFIPNLNSSSIENDVAAANISCTSQGVAISNKTASLLSTAPSSFDPSLQQQVNVYPNPFNNFITVNQQAISSSETTTLLIFDVTGQQLQSILLKDQHQQVATDHLETGLYVYQVTDVSGQMIANGKIVKQ